MQSKLKLSYMLVVGNTTDKLFSYFTKNHFLDGTTQLAELNIRCNEWLLKTTDFTDDQLVARAPRRNMVEDEMLERDEDGSNDLDQGETDLETVQNSNNTDRKRIQRWNLLVIIIRKKIMPNASSAKTIRKRGTSEYEEETQDLILNRSWSRTAAQTCSSNVEGSGDRYFGGKASVGRGT